MPEKVNIRRPPEREYDDGNAILEKHELCAALDLEVQLAMLYAFDTANLGSHGQGGFIATRSHLDSQARFCAAMAAKHFRLRLLGVIVWDRRTLVAGRVVRREASCKVFITGGVSACHAGTESESLFIPPRDYFAANQSLSFVRHPMCVPV